MMKKISMIAAIGKNNELGKNNNLIWHFKEDMLFFREKTLGSALIMGRKTFESMPGALPGRKNIILTSNPFFTAENAVVVHSIQQALGEAGEQEIFIIGGAGIYEQFLPLATDLYLTEIDKTCYEADTYFPTFDKTLYNNECIKTIAVNGTVLKFMHYFK